MLCLDHFESPLGAITLAGTEHGLTGLWFDGQRYDRCGLPEQVTENRDPAVFAEARRWLEEYFAGKQPDFLPALELTGSPFRRMVSEIMLTIPYGAVMTYGAIAKEAAARTGLKRVSARAVGGAVGHNPISILVPCHRVVGANGSLTGYAGGLTRKVWLLEHEGVSVSEKGHILPKTEAELQSGR